MSNGVNPANDIRLFRAIAETDRNRLVFADSRKPGAIESARNNPFGRAVVWLRKTFSPGHRKTVDLAYDRFAHALRTSHSHRGDQELGRMDALLAADKGTGKPLTSRRIKQVLSQLDRPASAAAMSRPPVSNPSIERYGILAEAARKGVDAASANLKAISSDLYNAEEFHAKLKSGDGGLRRGTTALSNIQNNLRPESLPPEALNGSPEQWRAQTASVSKMASQIAGASFNDELEGNFLQYGNSENPFSRVVDHAPQLDQPARRWLAEGLELADRLLQAQERARDGLSPLGADQLDGLQQRVDAFADRATRSMATGRPWSEQVLDAALGKDSPEARLAARSTETPPAPGPDNAGAMLPSSFDRAGAIGRLDQEIALQRQEIARHEDTGQDPEGLDRMRAELDAREVSRDQLTLGRDPRDALRSRMEEVAARHGAQDPRSRAYDDTVKYFTAAGAFAETGVGAGKVPESVDTAGVLADWRGRLGEVQARAGQLSPRSDAEIERAEAFADVSGFMQQAIVEMSSRRDPRPELIRHAANLEHSQIGDGGSGAGEASMLRTMAKEYTLLLQESEAANATNRS